MTQTPGTESPPRRWTRRAVVLGGVGAAFIAVAAAVIVGNSGSDMPSALAPSSLSSATASPSATEVPLSDADECFVYVLAWVLDLSTGSRTDQDVYYELGAVEPLSRHILASWYRFEGLRLQFGEAEAAKLAQEELDRNCRGPYLIAYLTARTDGKIVLPFLTSGR